MVWLFISVLIWGCIHSLLASQKIKMITRDRLGDNFMRYYRLVYNLLAGLSFIPVMLIYTLFPDRRLYLVPLPWSLLMVLGEILALAAMVAGLRVTDTGEFIGLRQMMEPAKPEQKDFPLSTVKGTLVVSGVYRYVRHPLYSAGIAFIWLLPMMTINILVMNIALTLYVVVGSYLEERKLLREFGRAYAGYAAITPMFIPFLKRNKKPG
jgi:methanethiol S-methyltransferase